MFGCPLASLEDLWNERLLCGPLIYVPSGGFVCVGRLCVGSNNGYSTQILFGDGEMRFSESHDGQEQFPMRKELGPAAASHWDGFIGMAV